VLRKNRFCVCSIWLKLIFFDPMFVMADTEIIHGIHKRMVQFQKLTTCRCVFSKLCTKLTLHCNHRSGHLKTEHTESLFLLRRHLGNWPRSKHEKRTAGGAWETWTVAAADGVGCARVRWEINLLLTFETAPFFCVYPVHTMCSYAYGPSL